MVSHMWPCAYLLPPLASLSSFVGVEGGWSFLQGCEMPGLQVQGQGLPTTAL